MSMLIQPLAGPTQHHPGLLVYYHSAAHSEVNTRTASMPVAFPFCNSEHLQLSNSVLPCGETVLTVTAILYNNVQLISQGKNGMWRYQSLKYWGECSSCDFASTEIASAEVKMPFKRPSQTWKGLVQTV